MDLYKRERDEARLAGDRFIVALRLCGERRTRAEMGLRQLATYNWAGSHWEQIQAMRLHARRVLDEVTGPEREGVEATEQEQSDG